MPFSSTVQRDCENVSSLVCAGVCTEHNLGDSFLIRPYVVLSQVAILKYRKITIFRPRL